MRDPEDLLHQYLDQPLTAQEQAELGSWLAESPAHARRFTELLLLHNQLRSESLTLAASVPAMSVNSTGGAKLRLHRRRRQLRRVVGIAAALLLLLMLFNFLPPFGERAVATAASAELSRLIDKNRSDASRSYQVEVESVALAGRRHGRKSGSEKRPPKPPMDNAVLHLRGNGLFVLIRRQPDGRDFVTGSNGHYSWSVRPDSPVRISRDLQRFSRDLPGHEYSLSLVELTTTLQQLQQSCDVQILEGGAAESANAEELATAPSERLLVAVRRPGFSGPRRIEIAYNAATHEIHQLRFIDMPYGPERLSLRLTLISRDSQPETFFHHSAHHPPEIPVEQE